MSPHKIKISLLALLFYSCSDVQLDNSCFENERVSSIILEERKEKISFSLDSLSPANVSYSKILELNDTLYYSFINNYNRLIYVYNYHTKKLIKKIPVTGKMSGYEIINWDSIVTYRRSDYKLVLQDSKANVIKTHIITPQIDRNGYYAMPTSSSQVLSVKNNIYMVGGHRTKIKADDSSCPMSVFDLSDSKSKYIYKFPEMYKKNFFGGSNFRMDISYCYNRDKNLFVFSFPAAPELFVTNDLVNDQKVCAATYLSDRTPAYSRRNDEFEYVANNPFYISVLYDPYRAVYYRICLLPANWSEGEEYSRDLSVIVLDKAFNFLGETYLKNKKDFVLSYIRNTHVSPDGLLFQSKGDIAESSIQFKSFKLGFK